MERTEQTNKLLLASKAWEGSGHERGPFPVDGMAADEDTKHLPRLLMAWLLLVTLLVVVPSLTAYVLRDKINYLMGRYGVPVEVKVP